MVQLVVLEPQLCTMENCVTGALGGNGSDQFIREEIEQPSPEGRHHNTKATTLGGKTSSP